MGDFNAHNYTFFLTFLNIGYIWVYMGFYGSIFRTFISMFFSYCLSLSFLFNGDGCGIVIWSISIRFSTLDTNPPNASIVSWPSILSLTKSMSTSLCVYLPSYGIIFEKQYVSYPRAVIQCASLCSEWFLRNAVGDGLIPSIRGLFVVWLQYFLIYTLCKVFHHQRCNHQSNTCKFLIECSCKNIVFWKSHDTF